jgi:hypothetical protein
MTYNNPEKYFTREQIYELVWSKAMRHAGPELGISDVALRKICIKHRIPIPAQGYWARKAAGHSVIQPALRPISDTQLQTVRIDKASNDRYASTTKSSANSVEDEHLRQLIAHEELPSSKIIVPQKLLRTHPLIRATHSYRKASQHRVSKSDEGSKWENFHLSIEVSNACFLRAMKVFQAFLQAFLDRGHEIQPVSRSNSGSVQFIVLSEPFSLTIRETQRMIRLEPKSEYGPRVEYEPKGELQIILSDEGARNTKTWRDGATKKIEDVLNNVIVWMLLGVDRLRKERVERARQAEEYMKREQERQERIRKQERDAENHQRLLNLGEALRTSESLFRLLERLRIACDSMTQEDPQREAVNAWIVQAEPYIKSLDPLSNLSCLPAFVTKESQENSRYGYL